MAKAKKEKTFQAPIEKIYQVITDYESYPEFMEGVNEVEVIDSTESNATVRYHLKIMKSFEYTINLKQEKNKSVSWDLDSGDLFKTNSGSWTLKDNGDGTTDVTYEIEVDLKLFAPKMIVNKLVETTLPSMMKSVEERAQNL